MITLDGSTGGGQVLRTALALSCITQKPFRMANIRGAREQGGLKAQHLACITALKKLCNAYVEGDELGSKELYFIPRTIQAKNIEIDIGTAGSIPLVCQAILLPMMFSQKSHTLTLIGGTDVPASMPIDYLDHVVLPHYRKLCD